MRFRDTFSSKVDRGLGWFGLGFRRKTRYGDRCTTVAQLQRYRKATNQQAIHNREVIKVQRLPSFFRCWNELTMIWLRAIGNSNRNSYGVDRFN